MRKEIPIPFSTQMVQAILASRKTQTRRVVKPQTAILTDQMARMLGVQPPVDQNHPVIKCPYGKPGDLLWVRETWAQDFEEIQIAGGDWSNSYLNATGGYLYKADGVEFAPVDSKVFGKWKPSIHMPKAAARILLQVTDVRVERLQDISEDDAKAEGVHFNGTFYQNYLAANDWECTHRCAIKSFQSLWKSINGAESWDANPWVWVVSFKVLSTTGKP